MDFIAMRLQKNIGKDRKSSAGANDILDLLQTFKQFLFRDTKFHYDGLRCIALGFIRQQQSACHVERSRNIRWIAVDLNQQHPSTSFRFASLRSE
jgi:hypothetical protein